MNADDFDSLTERVPGAIFEVANTLGAGFLERVYERALLRELCLRGTRAKAQASFSVTYKGHYVGEYYADILVEGVLVIELKCVERLAPEHTAQCLNYVRASGKNSLSASQSPETQSRVEAYRPWVSDSRAARGAGCGGVDTPWPGSRRVQTRCREPNGLIRP